MSEAEALFPRNEIARPVATPNAANLQSSPLSEAARTQLTQLAVVAEQLLSSADAPHQELAAKARQLGLALEEQLGQAVRRLSADSDHAAVRTALDAALRPDSASGQTLKGALLQANALASELATAGLNALSQDIGTLLRQVTGQQIMQSAGTERSDLLYQFSAVPFQHDGRQQTVELHVMSRKATGQKQIDPANCYVLFRLDMPNLGELDIHLNIVEKVVGLRFLHGDDPDKGLTFTAQDRRDLTTALQSVGFHLGVVKVEEKKNAAPGEHQPLLPPILTQSAFDLKV